MEDKRRWLTKSHVDFINHPYYLLSGVLTAFLIQTVQAKHPQQTSSTQARQCEAVVTTSLWQALSECGYLAVRVHSNSAPVPYRLTINNYPAAQNVPVGVNYLTVDNLGAGW